MTSGTTPLPEHTPDALPPGTRITHFEIKAVLGSGGMGIVYRASDLRLGRDVAIKCIRPDRATNPELRERIVREARATSRLSHPGIVRVLDVLEVDGLPAIVMDLVEGASLRTVIARQGPLELEALLAYGEDLSGALAAAHSAGVLHRDVNPNNVLISADGRALLSDFGLARHTGPADGGEPSLDTTQSTHGMAVGTFGYMSPEQLLGRPLDTRTDIFSLGAVLYEMATGVRAYPGPVRGEVDDATLNREPQPITRLNYAMPEELDRIIRKAMAKRPDERYLDARELQVDLRALRRRASSGAGVVQAPPRRSTRQLALLSAKYSVLATLAGTGLWLAVARIREPEPFPTAVPRQLTSSEGLEIEPAISPDGSMVAYASNETGDFEIFVADVANGRTLRITQGPASDRQPAWFPDNSGLAFVSDRGGTTAIWKTSRLGGPAVLLVPDATDPAISPDGTSICFARQGPGGGNLRLWVARLSGDSQAGQLNGAVGLGDLRHPAWSPDGSSISYQGWEGLWLIPASGGRATRLAPDVWSASRPRWSANGRFVYCDALVPPSRMMWRAPVKGGKAQRLPLAAGEAGEPSVSQDGRLLAYATLSLSNRIVLASLETGARATAPHMRSQVEPTVSRDGARLWFLAAPQGHLDVWTMALVNGLPAGEASQLTELGNVGNLSVSPDGLHLAYLRIVNGQEELWTSPASGGLAQRQAFVPGMTGRTWWSSDGGHIAFFTSQDDHAALWVVGMSGGRATGPPARIASWQGYGIAATWSPASDAIAFVNGLGNAGELWVVPADGSSTPRRVTSGARATWACWGPDPDHVLVAGTWGGGGVEVRSVRLATGESRPLSPPLSLTDALNGRFTLGASGRLAVYVEQHRTGHIWVAEAVGPGF